MRRVRLALIGIFCIIWIAFGCGLAEAQDFSFIHLSDAHSGAGGGTVSTLQDLAKQGEIVMEPYGVTAAKPSFVIDSGDFTEFGPFGNSYTNLLKLFAEVNLPRYPSLGNHDGTWRSLAPELTAEFGAPYYSFDKFGCHFVVLNTAGLQDPSPTICPDQIEWLKSDLRKAGKKTPVFIAFHHPLGGSEFASRYQMHELVDTLRPYNIVLMMVGHGHSAVYLHYDGYDMVEGGSTYGPGAVGYNVVSVQGDMLRVAYKHTDKPNATVPLLEKKITRTPGSYPVISILSPKNKQEYSGLIKVDAKISRLADIEVNCELEIDSGEKTPLQQTSPGRFTGTLDISGLTPGAHYARFIFTGDSGNSYHKSCVFYAAGEDVRVRWRRDLKSAVKSTPLFYGGKIYIGTYDGRLVSVQAKSGRVMWTKRTGYAISSDPAAIDGKIIFGCTDANLYCLDANTGREIWKFTADDPIFCSPIIGGGNVGFASGTGAFYSINIETGRLRWRNTHATYNVESKPHAAGDRIYYGAWDSHIYCISAISGELVWKCMGQGSAEKIAPRYYSPADCGPVLCGRNVFAPDRKYRLSIINASTGKMVKYLNSVSAVGLSQDGRNVYLRGTNGKLSKVDSDANVVWSVSSVSDTAPVPPLEHDGKVYLCSKRGMFNVYSASDGAKLAQFKLTPGMFALAGICVADGYVVMCGTDGVLTSIGIK